MVSRHGKHRFQTGMVTASLLNRSLSMADAREVARSVRESVAGLDEITTDELSRRIDALVETTLGPSAAARVRAAGKLVDDGIPLVETARGRFPFSKGVVLRDLDTSGVELDAAVELARDLEQWARQQGTGILSEGRVHLQVAHMLAERHGQKYARRYRMMAWVRETKRSVIVLIGGATGTGKSTLAMELAYRLGFVWVTSTDMIRETMRTVVSAELAPGLHDHSFRGILLGGQVLSDPRERVLAGFRQQAGQVAVGVRAVIQRALLENAHIIIEGTHLIPPFGQYVPLGVDVSVAGLILALPDEVEHKNRFPHRGRDQALRPASTYLDAFQSVRWIHNDLLRMAEEAEAVVLPNVDRSRTLMAAIDFLSRELPVDAQDPRAERSLPLEPRSPTIPTLLLVLEGLGDEPNPALGGKTPLGAAQAFFLRRLASSGGQGLVVTNSRGVDSPSTEEGLLALLDAAGDAGTLGRGVFEAMGQGLRIPPHAILLRGNLATVEPDGSITDRRAQRIREGVQDLLADLGKVELSGGIKGRIVSAQDHRVLVMLVGTGLSAAVSDTDPGDCATVRRVGMPRPLDDSPEAGRTADALGELLRITAERLSRHPINRERAAQGLLPANTILTRGAAAPPKRPPSPGRLGALVAGCHTALGVARHVGLKTATSVRMTGGLDTDLDAKFETAAALFQEVNFVVVHIKGTDVAAHERRALEKRDFISAIDAALGRFLLGCPEMANKLRVVVSSNHGTSSISSIHLGAPVPLLLSTWRPDVDDQDAFDEESCKHGALGVLESDDLTAMLGLAPARAAEASVTSMAAGEAQSPERPA